MTADSLADQDWLDYMTRFAIRDLKEGRGFAVSTGRGAPMMVQFSPDYRLRRNPATRYEIGPRAWHLMKEENDES